MNDEPELPEGFDQQFMTIELLRDEALGLFDQFIAHRSGLPPADAVHATPADKKKFLTLEETENIVREHAVIGPGVYAVGGDTREEAVKQIRVVMAALMQRIMSNLLNVGAGMGLLEVMFDGETNDFRFDVSEKGKKVYDRVQDQIDKGTEVDFDLGADEKD